VTVMHPPDDSDFPGVDLPPEAAVSRDTAVRFLVNELVRSGRLNAADAERTVCQLFHRESLGSTAIGRGVAIPHTKSDVVSDATRIIGRSTVPIAWQGSIDGEPVHLVYLLLTPTSKPGEHLRALEEISRRLRGR
jgi:nitrogen PTS system EIIA component